MARLLELKEFAFQDLHSQGIGAKNTISNGPDDGTLNKLANCFWNPMRHGSTGQAVSNGISLLEEAAAKNTGELNLGGHGNAGLVETGMGQSGPFDLEKLMCWNEWVWGPVLEKILPAPVTQITIFACHTGEGDDGSNLIFSMAKHCQRAVRAGTGFLYTNGQSLWWETGTVIQVATPTYRPPAVQAPTHHDFATAKMEFNVNGRSITADAIQGISYQPKGMRALGGRHNISGTLAAQIAQRLFASQALNMTDIGVAGFVTGVITVDLGAAGTAEFNVYNDRLAVQTGTNIGHYLLLAPGQVFITPN